MAIRTLFLSTFLLAAYLPAGAIAANVGEFKKGQPLTLDIPISATDTCAVVIENVTPAAPSKKMTVTVRSLSATQLIDAKLGVTFGAGMFSDDVSGESILNMNRELIGSTTYENTRWPLHQYSINVILKSCKKSIPIMLVN